MWNSEKLNVCNATWIDSGSSKVAMYWVSHTQYQPRIFFRSWSGIQAFVLLRDCFCFTRRHLVLVFNSQTVPVSTIHGSYGTLKSLKILEPNSSDFKALNVLEFRSFAKMCWGSFKKFLVIWNITLNFYWIICNKYLDQDQFCQPRACVRISKDIFEVFLKVVWCP